MNNRLIVACLLLCLTVAGCDQSEQPENNIVSISIMTFNVENLFDNNDDPGKDDKAYLPLADKQSAQHKNACNSIEVSNWRDQCLNWDWNDEILDKKLSSVAKGILQVDNGKGPDIIALQEIENVAILERLRNDYLAAANYEPAILIEGNDERGIDIAFLSRLPLVSDPTLHKMSFNVDHSEREADTRGILQADFQLPDGSTLTGFAVHFPAPYHPTDMRIDAYERLNAIAAELPENRPRFAAGDFNTTSKEDSDKNMLDRFARPDWTVAHDLGCGPCKGTSYYARDGSWSFLDMILWAPGKPRGENATWAMRESSVEVVNGTLDQQKQDGTPNRFKLPEGTGTSDHWPLLMRIELK